MTVKQNKSKPKIPAATEEQVKAWLLQRDLDLFLEDRQKKLKMSSIALRFQSEQQARCTMKMLKVATSHCKWFRMKRLKARTASLTLNSEQWEDLMKKLEPLLPLMVGRTLSECVLIALTVTKVNEHLMQGLPARLRVWRGANQ